MCCITFLICSGIHLKEISKIKSIYNMIKINMINNKLINRKSKIKKIKNQKTNTKKNLSNYKIQ